LICSGDWGLLVEIVLKRLRFGVRQPSAALELAVLRHFGSDRVCTKRRRTADTKAVQGYRTPKKASPSRRKRECTIDSARDVLPIIIGEEK